MHQKLCMMSIVIASEAISSLIDSSTDRRVVSLLAMT